jgi:L-ascorbate metabolism protein UlaG (beta-lactamase superfamily)
MIEPFLSDDALLADVESVRDAHSDALHLWWLGQSGFLLYCHGRTVLFDPYLSDSLTHKYANTEKPHVRISRRVVDPARLDFVDVITSTHAHTDHLDAETLLAIGGACKGREAGRRGMLEEFTDPARLLFPASIRSIVQQRVGEMYSCSDSLDAFGRRGFDQMEFIAVPAAHETLAKDPEGQHLYLGYVWRYRGWTVYHSGDGVVYDGMVENLRDFDIDVAILPINGKVGNMNGADAAGLAKAIGARLVVPCHYDMFEFNTADPGEQFVPACERLGQPHRVLRLGERLTIEKETV